MKRSSVRHGLGFVVLALALTAARAGAQEPPSAEELRAQLEAVEARLRELEARETARRLGEPDPLAPPSTPPGDAPAKAPEADVAAVTTQGLLLKLPLSTSLEVRGHLRVRGEYRNPSDYRVPGTFGRPATANPNDAQDFIMQRAWIGFDFRFHDDLHAVVSIMDSRLWGDQPAGQDTAETFVREAFVEARDLFGEPLGVRVGRGLIPALGDQRLFSSLDPWGAVPRLWDAVQLTYEPEGWMLTAFASNLREAQVQTPPGDENDDFWLVGAYASCRVIEKHELDVYAVWRDLDDRVFASEARLANGFTPRQGDREDWTLGARFKGETGPLGYSAEGVYQYGRQAGDTVDAWAAAAKAWFTQQLDDEKKVRIGLEYAFASGDQDPNDGRNETFDPLFPFGHFYHGHMDLMGWRNMHAVSAQLAVFPLPWLSLHADGHLFWLDKRRDAWYGAAKTAVRRDATGVADSHLGTELDLYVQARLWDNRLFLWTGYSHFWTGEYVRETGKSEDMDWVFCHLEFNF